jgi:thiamine pyrophosphate-dependent acetolactate synthase large subunit-like protein
MSGLKVYQAMARALAESGLGPMFGLVGDANLYLVDSFVREHGGRFLGAANESSAALMAIGHAALSGKVGLASVTHGPAVSNTLTALIEGVKSFTPVVLLCGDTAFGDRENLQDIPQRELVLATGAGFEQVRSPATAVADLARAVRRAQMERRPVALDIPTDMQHEVVPYEACPLLVPPSPPKVAPAGDDLDNVVGILAAARRPIVLAGRGAVDDEARAALLRLARRLDAPLATTLKAKGLFRGQDGDLGVFGTLSTPAAVGAILKADCVISFGASLTGYTTSHGAYLKGKRVVQVSPAAADLGRWHVPDVGLVAGVAEAVEAIVHWLDEAEVAPSGFRQELSLDGAAALPVTGQARGGGRLDYVDALTRLDGMLPPDRVLVMDYGRFMVKALQLIDVPHPRHLLHTGNSGSIGLGMSYAVGAGAAEPKRPVALFVGDGGFMLGGLAEFNAAARHGTDLIVVVCNDGSYGVEHMQLRAKGMDPGLVTFDWPDFAPLAQALGGHGVTVRNGADLDRVGEAIAGGGRPLLIDLRLDPDHVLVH